MVNNKNTAPAPRPLERAGREAAEDITTAEEFSFRGQPIAWVDEPKTKTIVTANAFGPDEIRVKPDGCRHLIAYDGHTYEREEFLRSAFQEYKKYPYRVKPLTDDVFRLGGDQRAKLAYHILSLRFPLVGVATEDKEDLEQLCAPAEHETAQRWYTRMRWTQGHEKIITFGVSLKMEGRTRGVWCYYANIDDTRATYSGVSMTWEQWTAPLLAYLQEQRTRGTNTAVISRGAIEILYCQYPFHLALPKAERDRVIKWLYQYLEGKAKPFPLQGDMKSEAYSFSIDYEKDVEIVRSYDLKREMSEYNREHNTDRAARRVQQRFGILQGDRWTTAELKAQGYTKGSIATLESNGLIKRLYKGVYIRNSL